jgi:hypothetical protein
LLAQPPQLLAALAMVEQASADRELADEAVAEERDGLAVIFRGQVIHWGLLRGR